MNTIAKIFDAFGVEKVYAHCDIPCGIYDPHNAQMAAHTVIRMVQLIQQMKEPSSPGEKLKFTHDLARYTATKEQHAELCKHEVRILVGDYFKPEHVEKHPEIRDLTMKVMKVASKARQNVDMQASEELLELANQIAEIFWQTKGFGTVRYPAPYPTEKETVYPTRKN